jgi:hypothetical protein
MASHAGRSRQRGAAEKLKPIFDGKTLKGWVQRGGQAQYAVVDGCVEGRTVKGTPNSFLCTKKDYGDFILELELKGDPKLNSGIQIRSECFEQPTTFEHGTKTLKIPAGRVHGYQVEVDNPPGAPLSAAASTTRAGAAGCKDLSANPAAGAAYKFGEWNTYRIECRGDWLRTWVNGVPAADLRDATTLAGFIGLQVHSHPEAGVGVRWRNLRLQDLGRHVWKPLWNGKNFRGWRVIGKGEWTVRDGMICGRHVKSEPEFSQLVTDPVVHGFHRAAEVYKPVAGNSGFYFRTEETGFSGVSGFQAEIDAHAGRRRALRNERPRLGGSNQTADDVARWFRPQDWNTMTVSAHGGRIVVDVNGYRTAELRDDPGRTAGKLALQLHGSQDVRGLFQGHRTAGQKVIPFGLRQVIRGSAQSGSRPA